jgi:hypothetical protein
VIFVEEDEALGLFSAINSVSLATSFSINCFMFLGFEVLTTVVMFISLFWDVTPCSVSEVKRRFGGTLRLHFRVE